MADAPRLFGVPMKPAHENGEMWCANGVWLHMGPYARWYWEVSVELNEVLRGSATRQRYACRQIERAITRIREAAARLGT